MPLLFLFPCITIGKELGHIMRTRSIRHQLYVFLLVGMTQAYTQLNVYGYFDLEAMVSNKDRQSKIWSFDQHHLNFISIYHLDDQFRLFIETEWEHGISLEANGVGSGKIYLAQGWLEYSHSRALRFQMGKILIPFGKYGLTYDATPTYLSTFLPAAVYGKHVNSAGFRDRLFAKWLTGLQIAGVFNLSEWGLEYFAYITNGRGPMPAEKDNNPNKGTGGRIILTSPGYNHIFGLSYYSDRDGTAHNTLQQSLGLDSEINFSNFKLEMETIFTRGQMVNDDSTLKNQYQNGTGFYVQGSYALRDIWVPFLRFDHFDPDQNGSLNPYESITAGLNISLTPSVYWKMEMTRVASDHASRQYAEWVTSVAVAF